MPGPRSRSDALRFAKAHAYGNDFLYVRRELVVGIDLEALARRDVRSSRRHRRGRPDRLRAERDDASRCGSSTRTAATPKCPATASGAWLRWSSQTSRRVEAEVTIETVAGPKRLTRLGARGRASDVSHRRWACRPTSGRLIIDTDFGPSRAPS